MSLTPHDENSAPGWFTRERLLTVSLSLVTVAFIYLSFLLIQPFIPAIAFAVALAVATHKPFVWLQSHLKSRAAASAIAVVLVAILIVAPLVTLGTYLVRAGVESINELRSGNLDWQSVISRQPRLNAVVTWATDNLDVKAQLQRLGETIAGRASGVLQGSINIITQLGIMLFVLFFLYRDGQQGLRTLFRVLPLSTDETERLLSRISNTIRATINGSLTIALVQAVLAGVLYLVLRVPGAPLWAATTFVAALIPMVGTALIWGPISLYLVLTGAWIKAVILLSWGALAIGSIDNVLYPILVGDKLRLHTVPTFFSVFGGIAVFGPAGLILGPLVLAITIALLDIWWYRTAEGQAAEEKLTEEARAPNPPGSVLQRKGSKKAKVS